jgi:hypothetical protein
VVVEWLISEFMNPIQLNTEMKIVTLAVILLNIVFPRLSQRARPSCVFAVDPNWPSYSISYSESERLSKVEIASLFIFIFIGHSYAGLLNTNNIY